MRVLLPILLLPLLLFSQFQEYAVSKIDRLLLNNASAIIRLDQMNVSITSHKKMEVDKKMVVTVFNEEGLNYLNTTAYYNKELEIKVLNGFVLDKSGKEIEKFRKKDFKDRSAISNGTLYSEDRIKYIDYTPSKYPFTFVFEVEYETSDTVGIPPFYFLKNYGISSEKCHFSIEFPPDLSFRKKENNLKGFNVISAHEPNKYIYTARNLSSLKRESYSPSLSEKVPMVQFALDEFRLKGIDGHITNWNEFGLWMHDFLLSGQGELDNNTKSKIRHVVGDETNVKEKVRKVYEYVQNNTRYISVRLGIGGWKPSSAKEVDKVKYGDCKGLTNYTKALLNEVGVKSYYTVVYAGSQKRDLDPAFASLQGNHAFLNVQLEKGELWLECTNQKTPAGYLGTFTDDRMVLKITPDGGQMVKTKTYEDQENKQMISGRVKLNDNAGASGNVTITSSGIQYGNKYGLGDLKEPDIRGYYLEEWDYLNGLQLKSFDFENDKIDIEFKEELELEIENITVLAGDQWILTPNIFNRNTLVPKRLGNRSSELVIDRGYLDEDLIFFEFPENVQFANQFQEVNIKNEFGEYSLKLIQISDNELRYERRLLLNSGTFPKEKYQNYRDFRRKIAKHDTSKIILEKKT